jgi:hypothetical protein
MSSEVTHAYCIVDQADGYVLAVQEDDGDLSTLAERIEEFVNSPLRCSVVREPLERARHLLFEIHPDF